MRSVSNSPTSRGLPRTHTVARRAFSVVHTGGIFGSVTTRVSCALATPTTSSATQATEAKRQRRDAIKAWGNAPSTRRNPRKRAEGPIHKVTTAVAPRMTNLALPLCQTCLLYTSDAADELLCVD